MKNVSQYCKALGQISQHKPFWTCTYCLEHKIICVKPAFLAVTCNCETGNKVAFEQIKNEIEAETINDNLTLIAVMPDCPYVGGSLKGSFANKGT